MRKTMIAALAALMLAGGLSAISGATSVGSANPVIMVGEGSAPLPTALPASTGNRDLPSLTNSF